MVTRRKISLLAAFAVLASLAGASPALADSSGTLPSGCSISPSTPSNSGSSIVFGGSAYCRGASSADFRLVHNYGSTPDARVKNVPVSNVANGPMSYTGVTCDNGPASTEYYSEIRLYVSGSPQRVSKTVTLSHC
ncbi:hypothetical protein [Clavibacter nebraskensis]|uniref:hypothetical protein n=1 Tax=Clavibacter nebraskensis TaxID=31963 RepID=UPI003F4B3AE1